MTKSAFKSVLEEILSVPTGTLKETDTRDTIEEWSSLADVEILTLVLSEFGIETDNELLQYESVGELLGILERRRAFA
jgi:acyl carrier protein